jgi:hypothetical protein
MTLLMSLGELDSAFSVTEYKGENSARHKRFEAFSSSLGLLLNSVASVVEKVMLINLSSRLGLKFVERESFEFFRLR